MYINTKNNTVRYKVADPKLSHWWMDEIIVDTAAENKFIVNPPIEWG